MNKKNIFYAIFFILLSVSSHGQSIEDSLLIKWKTTANKDTVRLEAADRLCIMLCESSRPDSGLHLAQLVFDYARLKKHKRYMALALARMGKACLIKGDYIRKMEFEQQSLTLSKEIGFLRGIGSNLVNIGNTYSYYGNHAKAVELYYESLQYFEKNGDKKRQVVVMANIAHAWYKVKQLDSAVKMTKRCLGFYKKPGDNFLIAGTYHLLGIIYYDLNKPDSTIKYETKAIQLNEGLSNLNGLANSYYVLAKAYLDKKDPDKTDKYLENTLQLASSTGDTALTGYYWMTRGVLARQYGKQAAAIEYGRKALAVFRSRRIHDAANDMALLLSEWLSEQNNYKEALEMHKVYLSERDSMGGQNVKETLLREQMKYDFEKRKLLVEVDHEKQLNMEERKNFSKSIWLTISLALLLVTLLAVYFIYRHLIQKNIIAAQKNNLLKQKLLVSQMNPHFIFNSLNALQNFIFEQQNYQAEIYLKQFSDLMRMILTFSTKDHVLLEDEEQFLKNYLELQQARFNNGLKYEIQIIPGIDKEAVIVPPMLAQPFIENAIEHGIFYKDGQGSLSIRISRTENCLVYEIEDDGIGLLASQKLRGKTLSKNHQSMAINITRERIGTFNQRNKTDFKIVITDKVTLNKGTTGVYVRFNIPYLTL